MGEDKKHLLAREDQPIQDWSTYETQRECQREDSWTRKALYVSLSINALFSIALLFLVYYFFTVVQPRDFLNNPSSAPFYPPQPVWTPAKAGLEYEYKSQWSIHTDFRGAPGPSYSEQWSDLLSGTLLNVTHEELTLAGEIGSVEYTNGGYAAALGIGHDMHCFKRLKDFLWLEHLRPGIKRTDELYTILQDHADHCLDILRQQTMCQPDVSLYNLTFIEHSKLSGSPAPIRHSQQKCVNYPKLQEWMRSRAGDSTLFVKPDWIKVQPNHDS